jgi:hypothetical protein
MSESLPAKHDETAEAILNAARDRTPFLRFKKGAYFLAGDEIPLGREYIVYCGDWARSWTKFANGKVVSKKYYRVASGERPPDRNELGDNDQIEWEVDENTRQPRDPWLYEELLPMEDVETGKKCLFSTNSVFGTLAVELLCREYALRLKRGRDGLPTVKLGVTYNSTKQFSRIASPDFQVAHWDGGDPDSVDITPPPSKPGGDMNDSIPF